MTSEGPPQLSVEHLSSGIIFKCMCAFLHYSLNIISTYSIPVRTCVGAGDVKMNRSQSVLPGHWCLIEETCHVDKCAYAIKDDRSRL